ncbi:hypothetical protein KP509_30G009400 [Ceratopteris richardii]|uniref:Large ribosomal subunit protein uL30m n=1 Tax=Ceratopteris richardii TaxID=49495 RepID=A0A8T2R1Y6_CERRI|nr:hypothetical protein KP509_30G009400 [Ceratopteris richardii]
MAISKASVPIAWSARLAITLVRGLPGTLGLHGRTLKALRLQKCNRNVIRENTPTIRGMVKQVKRHLAVETEEMYLDRLKREAEHKALRPPIVMRHSMLKKAKQPETKAKKSEANESNS